MGFLLGKAAGSQNANPLHRATGALDVHEVAMPTTQEQTGSFEAGQLVDVWKEPSLRIYAGRDVDETPIYRSEEIEGKWMGPFTVVTCIDLVGQSGTAVVVEGQGKGGRPFVYRNGLYQKVMDVVDENRLVLIALPKNVRLHQEAG